MFSYLYNGTTHTNTSKTYMRKLGLDDDAIEGVLSQKAYEESQEPVHVTAFKAQRQSLIDTATVITSSGKSFDANERSIIRLGNAVIKLMDKPDSHIVPWSTADVDTGVMVECTKAEIVEAHELATDNFAAMWEINQADQ